LCHGSETLYGHCFRRLARIVPQSSFSLPLIPPRAWVTVSRIADFFRCSSRGRCHAHARIALRAPCRVCTRILDTRASVPFCRACTEAITRTLPEPLCAQCGGPSVSTAVANGVSLPRCRLCRGQAYTFDFARSFRRTPWGSLAPFDSSNTEIWLL